MLLCGGDRQGSRYSFGDTAIWQHSPPRRRRYSGAYGEAVIQNDAIERCGLKQLLFEPEMLNGLEPDISTAALDFRTTIRRNLVNYDSGRRLLLPERFWFYERASKAGSRTVILDIDQSGSMGESAVYSSVMGCILASINSLKTHIVAFDTAVTDLTELCSDPVDLLYGIQLGGGTDIERSVAYCSGLVSEPEKTTMFLITDLYEGGNRSGLLRRLGELRSSGVNVVVLLAISDSGRPIYDEKLAEQVAALDIPCFACPPERLPELLEAALKKHSLSSFTKQAI